MKHILMVDDITTNLKVAAQVLQPFYELSMAKSGRQALNFLKKNKPDLILLDLKMPDMDGYETLSEIKLNPRTSDIPIIFLTADNERESEIKGLQMGALDFISKPLEEKVLLGRIEKVLQMEDMRKKIITKSENDFLTGFLLEDSLESKVNELLETNEVCLIYVDFDNFTIAKSYYDESFAPAFIKAFAEKMSEVFANAYIGKKSEDSFVICFIRSEDTDVKAYLKYVSIDCAEYAANKLGVNFISCSAVAALSTVHGNDYKRLFNCADKGMYYLKKTQNENFLIYDGR